MRLAGEAWEAIHNAILEHRKKQVLAEEQKGLKDAIATGDAKKIEDAGTIVLNGVDTPKP